MTTSTINLTHALETAKKACAKSRSIQMERFGSVTGVESKGSEGLVSEADLLSEKSIREILTASFPDIPVLGEEEAFKSKTTLSSTSWIVDPLDGTTNFIYGLPIFCTSIGLQVNGEMAIGVVDAGPLDRLYWAVKGQGAWLNGNRLKVSTRSKLSDSFLATGFYPGDDSALTTQLKIFSSLIKKSRAVRRAGAAALDLCLVAEGVFDGFWESNLKPWDTAAGILMVREAGGIVKTYEGKEFSVTDKTLVASSPAMYEHLQIQTLV